MGLQDSRLVETKVKEKLRPRRAFGRGKVGFIKSEAATNLDTTGMNVNI